MSEPKRMPTAEVRGRSLIGAKDVPPPAETTTFRAVGPSTGRELDIDFVPAHGEDIDKAAKLAWTAFHKLDSVGDDQRAAFLEGIADEIVLLGDALITRAASETGLGQARLVAERERAIGTLRLYAGTVRAGDWVRASIDVGDPTRRPIAKPDLRRMLRPLGPIAVFGTAAFPISSSTAGTDTASALAAGCPVVVKGHPLHPGTGEMVARAVARAAVRHDMPDGVFSFLHAGGALEREIGKSLVLHPCIRAVGFTGTTEGGKAIMDLARSRVDPIPVFAAMSSTNPVFVLDHAAELHATKIAEKLAASLTNANGQMCTTPGLVFVNKGEHAEHLVRTIAEYLNEKPPATMLGKRVRSAYTKRLAEISATPGVQIRGGSPQGGHGDSSATNETVLPIQASPVVFTAKMDAFIKFRALQDEVFGAAMVIVLTDGERELLQCASSITGSLTGSVYGGEFDAPMVKKMTTILEQRVGRVIYNGVPTGVEVNSSTVVSGPYPSSSQPHATAAGPMAMERWCRPICYQNAPLKMLPVALRNENMNGVLRQVNGVWTRDAAVRARAA